MGRIIAGRGRDEGMNPMKIKKNVIRIRGRVLCYNYLEGFFFSVVYRAMNGLCGEVHLASATLLFDSVRSGRRTKDFQKKKNH